MDNEEMHALDPQTVSRIVDDYHKKMMRQFDKIMLQSVRDGGAVRMSFDNRPDEPSTRSYVDAGGVRRPIPSVSPIIDCDPILSASIVCEDILDAEILY